MRLCNDQGDFQETAVGDGHCPGVGGSHEALESPEGGRGQQLTSAAESRQDSMDVNAVCL